MKYELTEKLIKKLQPPAKGNRIVFGDIPCFGVRVTAAGAIAFIYNYRFQGVPRRHTIGSYPAWTLMQARDEALRLRKLVESGIDPLQERQDQREAPTVKELSDLYMADDEIQKKSSNTKRNEKQMLDSIIIPSLGTRKAGSITRQDISKLHASLKATPYRANRVAALLSTMFSFAKEQRICQENPVKGVKKYHEEKRNRWLTPEEMSSLANAISNYPDQNAADCIRLLMLTGAREGEALNATWKEFDIEHGVWVKPSHHTKQKKTEYVTLSDAAIALLKRMAERKTGNFLFPGAEDENGEIKRARITIRRPWTQICKAAGLTEEVIKEGKRRMANGEKRKLVRHKPTVRIHDLRHNFASYLVSSGVSLPIIGRLLGHTQPQTTARYAHLQNDPLREAANKFPRLI